ncbi:uncharacterized protein LOC125715668 [Brienomyrus brachyistius]|uniref:uncharacterized protein LOC125715668 n=1 Tax=Brienomyrus brachyistius TaxID=42636 RepID=UPI0020B27139|nr:uncharacterized protein LOC125715668 [Brienomyrus brachyistius]
MQPVDRREIKQPSAMGTIPKKPSALPSSPIITRSRDPTLYPVRDLATAKVRWHPRNEGIDIDSEEEEIELQCPLVEVANPNREPDGRPETMLVYRPWTAEDRTAALKGIPPVDEGVPEFWTAILELQSSFHLNGREMFQCLRQLFNHKWGKVAGDFTGHGPDNQPLAHNSQALQQSMQQLHGRIETVFMRRADYGRIAQCKQKDGEEPEDFMDRMRVVFRGNSGIPYNEENGGVYQQQLKRAFITGLKPELKRYIDKHWVHQNTGSVQQALEYAQHAHTAQKQKSDAVFAANDTVAIIHMNPPGRGGFRGRSRGRGRGRGAFRSNQRNLLQQDNTCWTCGKLGHLARQCRTKFINNPNSTENQ